MSRTVHVLTSVAFVTTVSHCTKNTTSRTQGPAVLDIQGRNQRFCWEGAHQMEMVLCLCLLYLNALPFPNISLQWEGEGEGWEGGAPATQ